MLFFFSKTAQSYGLVESILAVICCEMKCCTMDTVRPQNNLFNVFYGQTLDKLGTFGVPLFIGK